MQLCLQTCRPGSLPRAIHPGHCGPEALPRHMCIQHRALPAPPCPRGRLRSNAPSGLNVRTRDHGYRLVESPSTVGSWSSRSAPNMGTPLWRPMRIHPRWGPQHPAAREAGSPEAPSERPDDASVVGRESESESECCTVVLRRSAGNTGARRLLTSTRGWGMNFADRDGLRFSLRSFGSSL